MKDCVACVDIRGAAVGCVVLMETVATGAADLSNAASPHGVT